MPPRRRNGRAPNRLDAIEPALTPEFALIARYFTRPARRAVLGVGDDAALIAVADGCELAISTDTLVSGVHFFPDVSPAALGHKTLAVNLSDLAAMGAAPRYATLALTLPAVDDLWLHAFAQGFFALAEAHGVELIGGDTTRGPLSLTVTVLGEVPRGNAIRRDGARPGDDVYVTGTVGGAALVLRHLQGRVTLPPDVLDDVLPRLLWPAPRLALGMALRGIASAMIDVSDGLVADLGHIGERSAFGATLRWPDVPLHPALTAMSLDVRHACALAGGDDYELCFTAPADRRDAVQQAAAATGVAVTRIGAMTAGGSGVEVVDDAGRTLAWTAAGFDHFLPQGE